MRAAASPASTAGPELAAALPVAGRIGPRAAASRPHSAPHPVRPLPPQARRDTPPDRRGAIAHRGRRRGKPGRAGVGRGEGGGGGPGAGGGGGAWGPSTVVGAVWRGGSQRAHDSDRGAATRRTLHAVDPRRPCRAARAAGGAAGRGGIFVRLRWSAERAGRAQQQGPPPPRVRCRRCCQRRARTGAAVGNGLRLGSGRARRARVRVAGWAGVRVAGRAHVRVAGRARSGVVGQFCSVLPDVARQPRLSPGAASPSWGSSLGKSEPWPLLARAEAWAASVGVAWRPCRGAGCSKGRRVAPRLPRPRAPPAPSRPAAAAGGWAGCACAARGALHGPRRLRPMRSQARPGCLALPLPPAVAKLWLCSPFRVE